MSSYGLLVFRPKTGFQLWLEENRKSITADHPDLEETDVIKEAMGRFRVLSAEERLVLNNFPQDLKLQHCKCFQPVCNGGIWQFLCS